MTKPTRSSQISGESNPAPEIIFLGNGPLADAALAELEKHFHIAFHARTKDDLTEVTRLRQQNPTLPAILASYGVIIPSSILTLFEPEGILNIHPSLLPQYRGPSPIESAILAGDRDFSVSVMKLAAQMDAGPIYYQTTLRGLPLEKPTIYHALATTGASWISQNLAHLPTPIPQDDSKATFTTKITRADGLVDPTTESAEQIYRKIIAFSGFPRVRMPVCGVECIILEAYPQNSAPTAPGQNTALKTPLLQPHPSYDSPNAPSDPSSTPITPQPTSPLLIPCADHSTLAITRLQPEGRRPMDAKSFLNGYAHH